jgi:putative glutamine amidotransferase
MRPLVGVSTSISVNAHPERAYVNSAYLRAVQQAGGVPVLLPPPLDAEARMALCARLHALVLTGGGDIDPARFDETPHSTVYDVSAARDQLELDLVHDALGRRVPLLAICRGIQVLNVALGGTLYQDIPSEVGGGIVHSQTEPRHVTTHHVSVGEGTRLASVLGAREIEVNSFHHQAVKDLGQGLKPVAWSPDGIVEGLEMPDAEGLVLAVQWHPEDLVDHDAGARALFAAVVAAAR